jgi:hypothetical protein
LYVVDLTNPPSGPNLGWVDTPGEARDVVVVDGHAYVADGTAGVQVVAIADPAAPAIVATLPVSGVDLRALDLEGSHLFAGGAGGFVVIDVADPLAPAELSRLTGNFGDVVVSAGLAYLVWSYNLAVVDVSDPLNPQVLSHPSTPGFPGGLALFRGPPSSRQWASSAVASSEYGPGDWGAVQATGEPDTPVCGDQATAWAPLTDGAEPEYLEVTYARPMRSIGLRIHETYTTGFVFRVELIDTEGGEHLVWEGEDETPCPGVLELTWNETPYRVEAARIHTRIEGWEEIDAVQLIGPEQPEGGKYLLVADGSEGLLVMDASYPPDLVPISHFGGLGTASSVAVDDGLAFVASSEWGPDLSAIDLGEPTAPRAAGWYRSEYGWWYGRRVVAVADGRAVHAGRSRGIRVFDVSRPVSPFPLAQVDTPEMAEDVATEDGYAYVANYDSLQIIDARHPRRAEVVWGGRIGGPAYDIAVQQDYVYLLGGRWDRFQVWDVSDPREPRLTDEDGAGYDPMGIVVYGDMVHLAGAWRLLTFDISDPYHIDFGSRPSVLPGVGQDLAVDQSALYVVGYNDWWPPPYGAWLQVLTRPYIWWEWPRQLGSIELSGSYSLDVDVSYPFVYALTDGGYLDVVKLHSAYSLEIRTTLQIDDYPMSVRVSGDRLVVAGDREVREYDIGDPDHPVLVGRATIPFRGHGLALDEDMVYVAASESGVVVGRSNPSLADLHSPDAQRVRFTVPPGMNRGPYDLLVENPEGESVTLPNAFEVCSTRSWSAELVPVLDPGAPQPELPLAARLEVEGDSVFFEPFSRHRGRLLLPPLPSVVETEFVAGDEPGTLAIELAVLQDMDVGYVTLTGSNEDGARRFWDRASRTGGIDLPALGERAYGDVTLDLDAAGGAAAADPVPGGAAHRYRYLVVDGKLRGAAASGPGADLVFEGEGRDDVRCSFRATASFAETRRAWCEEVAAAYPDLGLDCD